MNKTCVAPALAVIVVALGPGVTGPVQDPARSFPGLTEALIAEKDAAAPADDTEDIVSGDGRHVAWRTCSGGEWTVMLDGSRQGGAYDEVKSLEFSSDGRRLAFVGRRHLGVRPDPDPARGIDIASP